MTRMFTIANSAATLDLNNWSVNGLAVATKDLGAPAVREDTQDIPTQDGTQDTTRYFSQRVVAITGKAFNLPGQSRSKAWILMQPFLDPKQRSTLTFQMDDDMDPHQLTNLRISQWSKMASSPTGFAFQVQWKADPVALDATVNQVDVGFGYAGTVGRTYSRIYPLHYVSGGGGPGIADIVSNGTYTTWPIYQVFGPCTNPTVYTVDFDGNILSQISLILTVPAGQYVEINTQNRTVIMYDGVTPGGSTRYSTINFMQLTWAPLSPGPNRVRFTATGGTTPPANCNIIWQDAFLS